jgi:hypothetical protein
LLFDEKGHNWPVTSRAGVRYSRIRIRTLWDGFPLFSNTDKHNRHTPNHERTGCGGLAVSIHMYHPDIPSAPSPNFLRSYCKSLPFSERYFRFCISHRLKGALSFMCFAPQPPVFSHLFGSGLARETLRAACCCDGRDRSGLTGALV